MTVRYNQSGYIGSSKSVRAIEAEAEGKLPLSHAIPTLAKALGITRKATRDLLLKVGSCEVHHTSKYANLTDYYDLEDAAREFQLESDPLREEVEEAELCEIYGYDGWRWLGDICCGRELLESLLNSTSAAYALGLLSIKRQAIINLAHEQNGLRIQHSRNFRRWESALRRLSRKI